MNLVNEIINETFGFLNTLGEINTFLLWSSTAIIIIYGVYRYRKGKKELKEKRDELKKYVSNLKKHHKL